MTAAANQQTAATPPQPVFCKDCRHCAASSMGSDRCMSPHVPSADLVNGIPRHCADARSDNGSCAKDAVHFLAKEPGAGPAVIVYGPQGCGKTRNAAALAAYFGKTTIIDDWMLGDALPDDALCLTNADALAGADGHRQPFSRYSCLVAQYAEAIKAANAKSGATLPPASPCHKSPEHGQASPLP